MSAGYLGYHEITIDSGSLAEHNLQDQNRTILTIMQYDLPIEYIPN